MLLRTKLALRAKDCHSLVVKSLDGVYIFSYWWPKYYFYIEPDGLHFIKHMALANILLYNTFHNH